MFGVSLRRVYYVTDRVIVRSLRNRRFVPEANPGLQSRIEEFQKQGLKIEDEDADEFIEQSESDFYNVGEAYKSHVKETKDAKSILQQHIVKDKYFKVNLPNLLTWSEKEQIRHLATTEPDEWTPQKIAESFPVTEAVVKKLLKYPWNPATEERIARHDASAMRNWRELKEGTLNIPEDLRKHFLKFSERTVPPLSQNSIKIDLTQQTNMGEFESIVRKCAANEENRQHKAQKERPENPYSDEVKYHSHKKDAKIVTLETLADKIKKRLDKGKHIDVNDSIMLSTVSSTNIKHDISSVQELKEMELANEENNKSELTHFKEDNTEDGLDIDYTQRIRIPKKAYKKGATYKVNDCYYDDDGKFLYRVIGMTNE